MTTFTTNDREDEYKKILAEAPNQPGYEDAVPIPFAGWVNASPPHIVNSGTSVMEISALKLADLLDFDAKTLNWKSFADAATMIRQQQAEIERLKRLTKEPTKLLVVDDVLRQVGYVKAKTLTDDEIQELIDYVAEKPTNEDLYDFARAILRKAKEK